MSTTISEKLPEIFLMARDKTDEGRLRLANVLSDVFSQEQTLSDKEEKLLNEIIDDLVSSANPLIREMLAARLANATFCDAPQRVLLGLACDPLPHIAAPILRNAPLKDDDLIFVVESQGPTHALPIAERAKISEVVVDALVATGDIAVMTTVADNMGAKISRHAMHVLTDAARFAGKLQGSVLKRPELTLDMGVQLYWWLESELRRTVVRRFGITAGQIDEALENSIQDLFTSVAGSRNDVQALEKVVEWLDAREAVNSRVMIQCLRMGYFKLFSMMLSYKTGLDMPLVENIVAEDGGRSLAVLVRFLNIDKASFVSIFLLSRGARPGEQIVNPRELSQAIGAFDRVSANDALRILQSWKIDPSYFDARNKVQ